MRQIALVLLAGSLGACGPQDLMSSKVNGSRFARPFPTHPIAEVTPGDICDDPDRFRYPERIAYCERDVSTARKYEVIDLYDREFGFNIGQMNRHDFKIDHYISLCIGGSNATENLWPQHRSVYSRTDPIEFKLCRLLQQGRILQDEAIDTLRTAKQNLDVIPSIDEQLDAMLAD
jgi:hypothetical protein